MQIMWHLERTEMNLYIYIHHSCPHLPLHVFDWQECNYCIPALQYVVEVHGIII